MQTSQVAMIAAFGTATTFSTGAFAANTEIDAWQLLEQIEIKEIVSENSYEVKKFYPEDMEEAGKDILISGYAIPMIPGAEITELLMVSDMGVCPLCGNLDHGANLQITLAEPIPALDETKRITLRGNLTKVLDPETWQAAKMTDAQFVIQ